MRRQSLVFRRLIEASAIALGAGLVAKLVRRHPHVFAEVAELFRR